MRQFALIFQKLPKNRILKSNVIEILKIYVIEKLNIQKIIDTKQHTSPWNTSNLRESDLIYSSFKEESYEKQYIK